MNKFENLSIADTKSLLDYVNELKKERLIELRSEGLNTKDDNQFNDLDKLAFQLNYKLNSIVLKLLKD